MPPSDSKKRLTPPPASTAALGSSIRGALGGRSAAAPPPDLDTQQTIISKDLPAAVPLALAHLPPSEIGRLLEGQRLGLFELQQFVGGGGMGAVFRAHDTMLDRTVAVKVLSKVQSGDEETLRRFKNEAQSAARLDHENIGRVYYVGEDQGWHYIVFEFIEGINLRDLVDEAGPLLLAEAVSYTLQVADALAHASHRDVVHRDIKPSNVLITPAGRAKLVDMGLARLHQVEHSANDLTASGVTLGTFDYISPEQARDPRNADVRSDIYSLGCTVYFLLTGRPPFPEGTVLQKLLQHQSDTPTEVLVLRPDLPPEIARILARMLAKAPAERYQRPEDLMADLLELSAKYGLTPPPTSTVVLRPTNSTTIPLLLRHLPWLVPLAALVAVAIGVALSGRPADVAPPPLHHTPMATGPAHPDNTGQQGGATSQSVQSTNNDAKNPAANLINGNAKASADAAIGARGSSFLSSFHISAPSIDTAAFSSEAGELLQQLRQIERRLDSMIAASGGNGSAAASGSGAPDRKGLLVVTLAPKLPSEFASLRDACRAAKSGDVIEVRINGRLEDRPWQLAGQRLTIRAGEGFSPIVSFLPRESDLSQSSSMITLGGGQLTLLGLQLELDVPRRASNDGWSLATIRPGESLRAENCWLTLRNASDTGEPIQTGAAIINIAAVPGAGMMGNGESAPAHPPATLQLKNCIVRGEATFLHADESQPLSVTWENGLLTVSERLLSAGGNPSDPKPQGQMRIELRHVTVSTPGGVVQLTCSQDAALQLPLEFNASDSIFIGKHGAVLIDQSGVDDPEDLRKRVTWNGERNFYEDFPAMWRIIGPGGLESAVQLSAADWQTFWGGHEIQPAHDQVLWQSASSGAPPERPPHAETPQDFALRSGENPARGAASDGRDVGFQVEQLPISTDDADAAR